jgi:hypothetical protein
MMNESNLNEIFEEALHLVSADSSPAVLIKLNAIVQKFHELQSLVASTQADFPMGTFIWNTLETLDDKIHECLARLGE